MEVQKENRTETREEPVVVEAMEVTECKKAGPDEKSPGIFQDNRGVGVVEIILILVVLIALVVIFKEQLTGMVEKAMEALEKSLDEVLS